LEVKGEGPLREPRGAGDLFDFRSIETSVEKDAAGGFEQAGLGLRIARTGHRVLAVID
jgi:hypothetical protein